LIPSYEYARHGGYFIVPRVAIASTHAVDSVALFTKRPIHEVRTIALDTSSRTSVALVRVLCASWFHIAPRLVNAPPDVTAMLQVSDAALVIGDNALFMEYEQLGLEKIDLGEQWSSMTGLPFVYAFWAGRPGIVTAADASALQAARDAGVVRTAEIGREVFPDNAAKAATADRYLRENVQYALGEQEIAGLRRFYDLAAHVGVLDRAEEPRFY
jgi:chorismate dehydratase